MLKRWHYTQWQFNPICSYRLTPVPATLVSLRLSSCLSGRGPSRHRKQQKTERLLWVFVFIKIRAGLQLVAAVPLLLPSQKRWIWNKITRARAAAAPAQPQVIVRLRAFNSRVIRPDSVCLWTSPQSTGHWDDMPEGCGYESLHHQLPNIIIVTVSRRNAKKLPHQLTESVLNTRLSDSCRQYVAFKSTKERSFFHRL